MDRLLLRGEQIKSVARRYSVSEDALGRHKKHLQVVIAKAATAVEQKSTPTGRLMFHIVGAIAEFERELSSQESSGWNAPNTKSYVSACCGATAGVASSADPG